MQATFHPKYLILPVSQLDCTARYRQCLIGARLWAKRRRKCKTKFCYFFSSLSAFDCSAAENLSHHHHRWGMRRILRFAWSMKRARSEKMMKKKDWKAKGTPELVSHLRILDGTFFFLPPRPLFASCKPERLSGKWKTERRKKSAHCKMRSSLTWIHQRFSLPPQKFHHNFSSLISSFFTELFLEFWALQMRTRV